MDNVSIEEQVHDALKDIKDHSCKRCGFDQRQEFNPANEETLKEYFKATISQTPFTKNYQLFGGALEVEFEEATGKLLQLQERATLNNAQGRAVIGDVYDFALITCLSSAAWIPEGGSRRLLYMADKARRLSLLEKGEVPEELSNMPIIQLQAIRNAYTQFSVLCGSLVVAAQDENFWKGVGRN